MTFVVKCLWRNFWHFVKFVCNIVLHAIYDNALGSYHIMGFNCKGCFCVVPKIKDPGCECHDKVYNMLNETIWLFVDK